MEGIKEKLEERRRELSARVEAIERDIRRQTHGSLSADAEERSQEQENDEVLDALDDQAREELSALNKALARIDAGEYGRCEKCGDSIGSERLAALPYTSLCVGCA